mmetsp:Transcript_59188/g.175911  ORF Transcript_59188/g.175911 Transcript_59188/m.175911 type:complete len:226 (+) Transcript_59188:150-827(+)
MTMHRLMEEERWTAPCSRAVTAVRISYLVSASASSPSSKVTPGAADLALVRPSAREPVRAADPRNTESELALRREGPPNAADGGCPASSDPPWSEANLPPLAPAPPAPSLCFPTPKSSRVGRYPKRTSPAPNAYRTHLTSCRSAKARLRKAAPQRPHIHASSVTSLVLARTVDSRENSSLSMSLSPRPRFFFFLLIFFFVRLVPPGDIHDHMDDEDSLELPPDDE